MRFLSAAAKTVVAVVLVNAPSGSWAEREAGIFTTSRQVADCIRSADCNRVFLVAHRGRGFGGPDNSREDVRNAVAAGQAVIEIDLRRTRDAELVVFHDRRLDARTSGRGEIGNCTLADLRDVHLDNGEEIPRFSEIYEITRGRAVLVLHFQVDVVQEVTAWVASHGSFDDVIFYLDRWTTLQSAAPMKRLNPAMMVMSRAHHRRDLGEAREGLGQLPDLIHIYSDEPTEVSWFRHHGVKVAIKALSSQRPWPGEEEHRRARALASGAQLILVDVP